MNAQEKGDNQQVRVVGLYGMGGMGKTSICKALCNEFSSEFHGRVCHAELERGSREEVMREVLKRVTDASHELINGWRVDELVNRLNGGIIKEAVFLAVDNVSDTQASVDEARSYLAARLPAGSVVVVTARGRGTLMRLRPYVTESNVVGMPELDAEEAKSLFAASSNLDRRSEADEELVVRCVEQCHFAKGDGSGSKQYHPLTLDVLGKQLGCVERREWKAELDKIDADIFNRTGDAEHPIFSILRKSYDSLSREDQLLFEDVALDLFLGFRGRRSAPGVRKCMGPHVRRKVVLFGASMTEYSFCHGGWGASLANLYCRKADIVLRGYRGWNTRGALEVLDKIFPKDAAEQPELVVVFFGANDAAFPMPSGRGQHVPFTEFEDNLCRIAAHLQGLSGKTRVILTTAPPISEASRLEHGRIKFGEKGAKYLDCSNGRAGEYAAACRAAAQKMGVGNIDLWTSIQRQPDWQITCLTDGLHLSALGSAVMLEELLKVLKDSTWQPSLHYATISEDFSEPSICSYVHPSEEDVELARVSF